MGVDTKGFVATSCKDVCFVINKVERALNALIRPKRKAARGTEEELQYELVTAELSSESHLVRLGFTYAGEERMMWVFFRCDSDHADITPRSISLSMGCWGQSELFMKTALQALTMLGPVYYDRNDSDDAGYVRLSFEPLTYVAACAEKSETPSPRTLGQWMELFDAGGLHSRDCQTAIGLSEEEVAVFLNSAYETAQPVLKDRCLA